AGDVPADGRAAGAPGGQAGATGGRGFVVAAAVVVLVLLGSLATLSHTEPRLRPADSVPTTTTTTVPAPTDPAPGAPPSTGAEPQGLAPRPARTSTVATVLPEVGVVPVYDDADADAPRGSIDGIGDYGQRQVFL